ncbi:universal stress protein [Mycobacterium sp. SM1]|uniref:universal stress protein n=1 Tax=Mycobacterium sp. SM1 TaxID=2816243 RepID=UPI001BCA697C|nr:universal stress protein [Mycobacterium sp. SM1]MBS4729322.1 universal stress protein [Mycobacterium sp. SM1]
MNDSPVGPAVVVGVDGSRAALRAALWAVDEAVDRGLPLRLLCAIAGTDPGDATRGRARGELAVREVSTVVEAGGTPVRIEIDITAGPAVSALVRASRSAALVCVGAVGLGHFQTGRVGSTAAALAVSAHCPVAIVRGDTRPFPSRGQWIVVEADEAPDNEVVVEAAVSEARLRNAPLRAIGCWRAPSIDRQAVIEGDWRIRARLTRRLAPWRRRYPDLRIEPIVVHGTILDYLAQNAAGVQLLVMGAHDRHLVAEVVGPAGNAALGDSDCVVLVVNRRHL